MAKKKKMDSRIKLLATMVLTVGVFFISNGLILGGLCLFILLLMMGARLKLTHMVKQLKVPVLMVVVMLFIQLLISPSLLAVVHMGVSLLRLMIVIGLFFVLIQTTTVSDVVLALDSFLRPARKMGLKTDGILLGCRVMMRFVPSLLTEAHKILKAQASRGLDIKEANLLMKMRLIMALLLPVFVQGIKGADGMANTMAVRGYVLHAPRTAYRRLKRQAS